MHPKSCFELKGSLFTLMVLQLIDNNLDCLKKELALKVEMMPNFFNNTPIVIDLHQLSENQSDIDFKYLKEIICSNHMIPVGIKGSVKTQKEAIKEAGLAILAEAKQSKKEHKVPSTVAKAVPEKTQKQAIENPNLSQKTVLIKQTVRSGQQISAPDGDLIIIGSVSAGAEILAAGNIHVYGTLRGRALAGIKGDQSAGVFCHNLQAELISIAGIYLLCDDIPSENMGLTNHINLMEEKLTFTSI